jgi:hypothetical protein
LPTAETVRAIQKEGIDIRIRVVFYKRSNHTAALLDR